MKKKDLSNEKTVSVIYSLEKKNKIERSLFISKVQAGFPSPADDYLDKKLDLNEYLIKHPSATFFVRVSGDSMINAGIYHNDLLIVDRSLDLSDNKIIIAILNGELTVKRYRKIKDKKYLYPENEKFSPIEINENNPFELWGVVTSVIHKL